MTYLRRDKRKRKDQVPVMVIIDDREKQPWTLPSMFDVKTRRLQTGDYSFEGYTHVCSIEKKSGFPEFIQNISGKHRERFERHLARMAKLKYKAFVIEGSIHEAKRAIRDLPETRLTVNSVYFWLTKIQIEYGIPVYLIGSGSFSRKLIIENLFCGMAHCLLKETAQ